jgi:hypothetical protein
LKREADICAARRESGIYMTWPFSKSQKPELPPEQIQAFEQLSQFLSSEAMQVDQYPHSMKSRMLAGSNADQRPDGFGYFGISETNPIPVNGPIGEILYLSALRVGGKKLLFHRLRSINEIDVFECVAIDSSHWGVLYLDMYHPRKSKRAPDGHAIAKDNVLLSGVTLTVEDFPHSLYSIIVSYSERRFGMSIADPGIRTATESQTFVRPLSHTKSLGEISVPSKGNLIEELSNEVISAQTAIYDVLLDFHNGFSDGNTGLPKESIQYSEIVFLALTAAIESLFRWEAQDAAAVADKISERVLRIFSESSETQAPMGETLKAFRTRFPIYRDALSKLGNDRTAFGLQLTRALFGKDDLLIGMALSAVIVILLGTLKEVIISGRSGSTIYITRLRPHEAPDPGVRPSNRPQLRRSKTTICRTDST